jgi:VanZ family protein
MERTDRKIRLCTALLIVNVLFIWGNSLLPGSVSGAISHFVRNILAFLFPGGSSDPDSGHGLLRKLAHFTEFACLGALFAWLFGMLAKPFSVALPCGFLVACIDETIQRFVPNRGPAFKDVLIDTSGVLVGIGLLVLGYTIRKKLAKHSLKETTT